MREKLDALKREITDQDVYYELTPSGIVLCAGIGLAAELLVLSVLGVQMNGVPFVVFGFLWFLFGILVSGVLIGLEMLSGIAFGREYDPTAPSAGRLEPSVCTARWNTPTDTGFRKVS